MSPTPESLALERGNVWQKRVRNKESVIESATLSTHRPPMRG